MPSVRLEDHLIGCTGCREWQVAAEQVTRSVRLQAVEIPDLTVKILAAASVSARGQVAAASLRAASRQRILQVALAILAVAQLGLALPALFAGPDVHISREAASFDIAIAVGFALAAWRPERARAFVPVAFVLAGCLIMTSIFDLMSGVTHIPHEMSHVAALAEAYLLYALSRSMPRRTATSARPAVIS